MCAEILLSKSLLIYQEDGYYLLLKEYVNHEIWVLVQVLSLQESVSIGLLFYGSSEETMEFFKAYENIKFRTQFKDYNH